MNRRISINVEKIEPIGHGRVKVKIREHGVNLLDMRHEGREFVVTRSLGRGRYIMREKVPGEGEQGYQLAIKE